MSFLQRLKKGKEGTNARRPSKKGNAQNKVAQLDVDIFQTADFIVVYAQAAGAELSDIHILIEGNANEVIIEGKRMRPSHLAFSGKKPAGAYFTEECVWGSFYRKIILPEQVDISKAQAKVKHGVLVLTLPLKSVIPKRRMLAANNKVRVKGRG